MRRGYGGLPCGGHPQNLNPAISKCYLSVLSAKRIAGCRTVICSGFVAKKAHAVPMLSVGFVRKADCRVPHCYLLWLCGEKSTRCSNAICRFCPQSGLQNVALFFALALWRKKHTLFQCYLSVLSAKRLAKCCTVLYCNSMLRAQRVSLLGPPIRKTHLACPWRWTQQGFFTSDSSKRLFC